MVEGVGVGLESAFSHPMKHAAFVWAAHACCAHSAHATSAPRTRANMDAAAAAAAATAATQYLCEEGQIGPK